MSTGSTDDRDPDDDFGTSDSDGWRRLFAAPNPRVVLARLVDGDPLELWPRCIEHLNENAVLVPAARLYHRGVARVAFAAMRYQGEPALDGFLAERIADSLAELIEEDADAVRSRALDVDLREAPYPRVAAVLGIERPQVRAACVAFNALPDLVRRRAYPVMFGGRSIASCVGPELGPADEFSAAIDTALQAMARQLGRALSWRGHPDGGAPDDR